MRFFTALQEKNHTEALSYYISQSNGQENVQNWLGTNQDKIKELANWYASYS